jgi:hypothetical protein
MRRNDCSLDSPVVAEREAPDVLCSSHQVTPVCEIISLHDAAQSIALAKERTQKNRGYHDDAYCYSYEISLTCHFGNFRYGSLPAARDASCTASTLRTLLAGVT